MYKKKNATTMLRGFVRMICGVVIAALYAAAVYGFFEIPGDSGYVAVIDFLATTIALVLAIGGTYALGFYECCE